MKKTIGVLAVALAAMVAGAGETFKWTGAAGASWTNAANWQVLDTGTGQYAAATRCPGNNLAFTGDECIFGAVADGASTTVDVRLAKYGTETAEYSVTNIYVIHIVEGAPSYTFQGPTITRFAGLDYHCNYNHLHFENNGGITIDSGVTNDQYVTTAVGNYYREVKADANVRFRLDSENATLHLNGYAQDFSGWSGNDFYFAGVGDLEWTGATYGDWGPSVFYLQTSGHVTLKDKSLLLPKTWQVSKRGRITIPSGYGSLMSRDGSATKDGALTFVESATVDGGGQIVLKGAAADVYGVRANAKAVVTLDAVLHNNSTASYIAKSAKLNGAGTFVLCSSNDFPGALMLSGGVTVKAGKLGLKNCAATESNIGTGYETVYYGNGTLVHTGAAETCDRDFAVTNTANLTAGILGAGTGSLTLTGQIVAYGTGATLKMGGTDDAPLKFNGSFGAACRDVTLEVCGSLDFSALAAFPTPIAALTYSAGQNTLKLPVGVATTIPAWTAPATGSAIDFVTSGGATVTFGGITAETLLPYTVTLNGAPAKLAADGTLVNLTSVTWAAAADGNWKDAANWDPARLPTASDDVRVDVSGADYTVTVDDGSAAAVRNITVGTLSDDYTATVSVEKDLTFDGSRGIRAVKGGKIAFGNVAGVTNTVQLLGDNVALFQHGGTVEFAGDARLMVTTTTQSATARFGTGHILFKDRAGIWSNGGKSANVAVTPDAAGETGTVTFADHAYWTTKNNSSILLVGYNVPAGAVGICNYEMDEMWTNIGQIKAPGYSNFATWRIGSATEGQTGSGILNLKNGCVGYSNDGFHVAGANSPWSSVVSAYSGTAVTGLVYQTGGIVSGCSYMPGYSTDIIIGFVIGDGFKFREGNSLYGEYNLKAGEIQVNAMAMFGVGPSARGVLNVGDAANADAVQTAKLGLTWSNNGVTYYTPSVIGFGKGRGLVNVFGEKATVYFANGLYVGGTDVEGLRVNYYAGSTARTGDYTDAGCGSGTAESEGELRISAGGVAAYYSNAYQDIGVGADGKGTIVMSGTGRLTCRDLTLSNRTESVVRFLLPESGRPGWTLEAKGTLKITDGASLVVDASAATVARRAICLAKAAAVEGAFAAGKVTVLGDNETADLLRKGQLLYEDPSDPAQKGLYFLRARRPGNVIYMR